jgi:hypothetical protein
LGEEFAVGGYTPGTRGFDALIIGFYRAKDLVALFTLTSILWLFFES